MRRKTGKRGLMTIKVDLEKAYDRLNWSFIFETLQQMRLLIHLSRLIMECATSATMNILWNGEVTEEFYPGRGIRQGDPLSLYIFVLCIERLGHRISQAVVDGSWKPIRLVKHGTPLTHLFFADDLLLFAEASIDQAYIIDAVLENYCRRSYLGVPLLHSRVNKATYQSILDKVDMRLSGWNAAHLSFAGRVTLAQSVIQAMPIYAMRTTMLPSSVRHRIDKCCRRFIWDGKSKSHKMCMVGWDKICLPKSRSGLGFKNLEVMNHALLMKISWGIISNSNTLWVRVLCSKYVLDPCNLPSFLPDKQGSCIWSAIRKTWDATIYGARWVVCNSARIQLWLDCWVTKYEPLIRLALQPIPQVSLNATIASIMPPAPHLGPDRLYWCFNLRGMFTFRSAYESLCHHNLDAQDKVWNLPWSWKGPQSIKLFIWQILNGKLKTHNSKTIYSDIMARASEIHRINNSHLSQQPRRKEIFIGRLPPPWPWCKLNTDGSCKNTGEAGASGVIRDSFGNWISGFSMNIGESSVIMAELWGMYQGLSLA
ncbi:putative ribonuclease H protein [Citrus sinensis]|nr:putative ribonuclease H protein [Citrus sinensis]